MRDPSEHQEQQALVRRLRRAGNMVSAIPNGARVKPRERRWLLDEGMEPGFPDLLIRTPPRGSSEARERVLVVAVEMKRRHDGKLSEAQDAWIASVAEMPWWHVVVAHGAREAAAELEKLGYDLGRAKHVKSKHREDGHEEACQ